MHWKDRSLIMCIKHHLLSLIGKLSFACKVIIIMHICRCRQFHSRCSVLLPGGMLPMFSPASNTTTGHYPYMASPLLERLLYHYQQLGVALSTCRIDLAGVQALRQLCEHINIRLVSPLIHAHTSVALSPKGVPQHNQVRISC